MIITIGLMSLAAVTGVLYTWTMTGTIHRHYKHLAGDNNMRNHGNKLNCFFPPRNGPSRKSKLISKLKITAMELYIRTTSPGPS